MTTEAPVQDTVVTETPAPDAQAVAETVTGSDGQPFDATRAQALIEKLRGELKDLKPKAKLADELSAAEQKRKEAAMSELEKKDAQLKEAQAKLEAAERREMQRQAATKYNLPSALVDRLEGKTLAEMEADAKVIADSLPKQATINPTNPSGQPVGATAAQWKEFMYGNGNLPGV
jgi:hypothetical protein